MNNYVVFNGKNLCIPGAYINRVKAIRDIIKTYENEISEINTTIRELRNPGGEITTEFVFDENYQGVDYTIEALVDKRRSLSIDCTKVLLAVGCCDVRDEILRVLEFINKVFANGYFDACSALRMQFDDVELMCVEYYNEMIRDYKSIQGAYLEDEEDLLQIVRHDARDLICDCIRGQSARSRLPPQHNDRVIYL